MISTENISSILSGGGDVIGTDGDKVGGIGQVFLDDTSGEPAWVTVKTGLFGTSESFVPLADATVSGNDIRVAYDKDKIKAAPRVDGEDGHITPEEENELYRYYGLGSGTTGYAETSTTDTATTGTATSGYGTTTGTTTSGDYAAGTTGTDDAMTRSEEQLRVGTERQEAGRARLRKFVVTENVSQTVPVSHEEVRLEREPITDANAGDALSGPELTESEHVVTLHEERPVVEKETVPVERVRLDKETVTEEVAVNEQVRKEEVDIDDQGRGGIR
jgi:uncharacterized protein (TIGR02271 family)